MARHSSPWASATLVALVVILACTLFPFVFTKHSFQSGWDFLLLRIGPDRAPDVVTNVLLFVPFGVTLAGYLQHRRVQGQAAMLLVLVACFCCSHTVEVLQLFLPGRFSSLSDVLSNCAGGMMGFLGYSSWRGERGPVILMAYSTCIILTSVPLQWTTTFRNWNADFPLSVGNEPTGDRPWQGQVSRFSIFDRAISAREVMQLSHRGKVSLIPESLVTAYDLTGSCPCQERSGRLPALAWTSNETTAGRDAQSTVSHWLETPGPVRYLTNRLKASTGFTLLVTAATGNLHQTGAARIVSLSANPSLRNFTLAQQGSDLLFRLTTPLTRENGDAAPLPLIVPDVFATPAPRQVVITFDGLDLRAYLDGVLSSHAIRLGLGAVVFAPLFGRDPRVAQAGQLLFYAIAFVPAGVFISLTGAIGPRWPRIFVLSAAALACSLSFEAILAIAGSRIFSLINLFWSVVFAASGIAAFELARYNAKRDFS